MGLTNKKEEQLKKMPLVDFSVSKSKDGRYLIHRTTITDIKPFSYYEKVLSGESEQQEVSVEAQVELTSAAQKV